VPARGTSVDFDYPRIANQRLTEALMAKKTEKAGAVNFAEIRKAVIVALFSDDTLLDLLVLKGGNALALVYGIGHRSSLDVDMSIDGDFKDTADAQARILAALGRRFQQDDYRVVDFKFEPKPATPGEDPTRSGYLVQFKLIDNAAYERLKDNPLAISTNALVTSPRQGANFQNRV